MDKRLLLVFISFALTLLASAANRSVCRADSPVLHRVASDDGHALAVWEKRAADPRGVVLLLHGRTWSSIPDFDLQVAGEDLSLMDGLTKQGFAVYALDARGYGKTPRDETGWLTPNRASKDVATVLDWIAGRHAELPRPVLFGWSYGSMVSQLCVQRNPERVSGVVLFGYPVDPDRKISAVPDPGEPARTVNTAAAAASDFITPGSISPEAIQAYVDACLKADSVRVDWCNLDEWNELDPAKVKVPVLLMQGEFDPLAGTASHAKLFTRLATTDRQWVMIPGGDHAAFMETPRPLFLHVLGSFISRLNP